jgi:hypothetical protein
MNPPEYVREAIKARKWAFACDYIRLYALYSEGGIYLDSDVYLRESLDRFLDNRFFSAIETFPESDQTVLSTEGYPFGIQVQAAILGSEKGHPYVADCLDYYKEHHFIDADGNVKMNMIAPIVYVTVAQKYGMKPMNCEQTLAEGIHLYTTDLFGAHTGMICKKTVAVHCCLSSWKKNDEKVAAIQKFYDLIRETCYFLHIPSNRLFMRLQWGIGKKI